MELNTAGTLRKGVIVSLITSILTSSGCVAYKFSSEYPPIGAHERSQANFEKLVLGVELTDQAQSYELGTFVAALKKTGLFKEVEYLDRVPEADLILTSFSQTGTNPQDACPMGLAGQVLLVGSGGIVPQVCKTEHVVSFVLYAPNKKMQQTRNLSVKYEIRSVVGWAALFYMPSADWTAQPSEERYPDLLKKVFARESNGIQGLLK